MKFTCSRPRLSEVASLVGQAVAGKSTKKIFECLRIVAEGNQLEIAGTDLEVSVRQWIANDEPVGSQEGGQEAKQPDITVEQPGKAVVPAALLAGLEELEITHGSLVWRSSRAMRQALFPGLWATN